MNILSTILCALLFLTSSAVEARSYTNPVKGRSGSDPFIVYSEGFYYLTSTTGREVTLTRARSVACLRTGQTRIIHADPNEFHLWAPEFHNIDGIWWVFYTASANETSLDFQRSRVLQGTADIWNGPYRPRGDLIPDRWAIDLTFMFVGNRHYAIYSGEEGIGQTLFIAELSTNPLGIGQPFVLSRPTEPWETDRRPVNEGPAALYYAGRTYVYFSGSLCFSPNYQLGALELLQDNGVYRNPLNGNNWVKTGPIFSSANGNFGTGHNNFFTSPDGRETWNVYHATNNPNGACDDSRYTMVSRVTSDNGRPNLGVAPPLSQTLQGPGGEDPAEC